MSIFLVSFMLMSGIGEMSAAEALMHGETALLSEDYSSAAEYFNYAINSGSLNEAGYSMAYWNSHSCYEKLNDIDKSSEMLLAFIMHADNLSEYLSSHKSTLPMAKVNDFITHERMLYAKVLLDARWAAKNNYSCRSKTFACYLPEVKFLGVYKETIPFCSAHVKVSNNKTETIVDIVCEDKTETYYFGE